MHAFYLVLYGYTVAVFLPSEQVAKRFSRLLKAEKICHYKDCFTCKKEKRASV